MKYITTMIIACTLVLAGCGSSDGSSEKTKEQSSRLNEIQRKSGGDWAKLTDEDKNYLVNELAHGNENSAKMLLGPPVATPGKPK